MGQTEPDIPETQEGQQAQGPRRTLRWVLAIALAVAVGCLIGWWVNRLLTQHAVVRGGLDPGLAATDQVALRAAVHDEYQGPSRGDLVAEGRLFVLDEGTHCEVLHYESSWTCRGGYRPVRIEVLEGPRHGQVFWMCSDSLVAGPAR